MESDQDPLSDLKARALRLAGEFLASPTALSLLSNPQVQDTMRRAFNLRSDVRDGLDKQVDTLARSLNLVSRKDIQDLKRTIRELENQAAALEYELRKERERSADALRLVEELRERLANAAQTPATETAPKKTAPKKTTAKKPAAKKTTAKKPAAKKTAAKKTAAKKPVAKKTTAKKTAAKKTTAKKPVAKKTAAKKPVAKKTAAKKTTAKKTAAKKTTAKKTTAKKTAPKKTTAKKTAAKKR